MAQRVRALRLHLAATVALLVVPLSGCATVSMTEGKATTTTISLAPQSSQLHKASDAYCETARTNAWATGESSIGSLAGILTGRGAPTDGYWKAISADSKATPAALLKRIRGDAAAAAKGLTDVSSTAQKVLTASKPSKSDVTDYERALIHARQARDSFADALVEVGRRSGEEFAPAREFDGLDRAIASARSLADDLAAARMADITGAPPKSS